MWIHMLGIPNEKLQEMACKGKGIFQSVPDRDDTGDVAAEKAEYKLLQARQYAGHVTHAHVS